MRNQSPPVEVLVGRESADVVLSRYHHWSPDNRACLPGRKVAVRQSAAWAFHPVSLRRYLAARQ